MHFGLYNFRVAAHPHNAWLQIAAEYGLPMALLLTFLVLYFLHCAFHWCSTADSVRDRNINIAMTAALICGLTEAMFSGNTLMPQSQLLLFFIAGWLVGRNLHLAESTGYPDLPNRSLELRKNIVLTKCLTHTALIIVITAAIAVQVIGAANYYKYSKGHDYDPTTYYHPRYWQDGHWLAGAQEKDTRKELESDRQDEKL